MHRELTPEQVVGATWPRAGCRFPAGCADMVRAGSEAAVRHAGECKRSGTPTAGHQSLQKTIESRR
ncbi:hypothetical protein [Streptomyces sp. NPDC005322]|uniref:hypothetical protein n=1 Tax=Streptomyces sp. NPDC005322 TaxID=3157032 RepID=UPI0033BEE5A5